MSASPELSRASRSLHAACNPGGYNRSAGSGRSGGTLARPRLKSVASPINCTAGGVVSASCAWRVSRVRRAAASSTTLTRESCSPMSFIPSAVRQASASSPANTERSAIDPGSDEVGSATIKVNRCGSGRRGKYRGNGCCVAGDAEDDEQRPVVAGQFQQFRHWHPVLRGVGTSTRREDGLPPVVRCDPCRQ